MRFLNLTIIFFWFDLAFYDGQIDVKIYAIDLRWCFLWWVWALVGVGLAGAMAVIACAMIQLKCKQCIIKLFSTVFCCVCDLVI